MRIGILGGTFNPVHLGHLLLAEGVREALGLDKAIFVPTYLPVHKECDDVVCARHRLEMLRLATRGYPQFTVSDIEIRRRGPSYTIDTVGALRKRFGRRSKLFFIAGSDALRGLKAWKEINRLLREVSFVVVPRPGYRISSKEKHLRFVKVKTISLSSREIRDRVRRGSSIRYMVVDTVRKYIEKHRLYT
jgi:nicotinate-nucleotide adenylyltransferase